jgi:translation initiation factor IF-1
MKPVQKKTVAAAVAVSVATTVVPKPAGRKAPLRFEWFRPEHFQSVGLRSRPLTASAGSTAAHFTRGAHLRIGDRRQQLAHGRLWGRNFGRTKRNKLPKDDAIEVMGKVVEKFRAGMFSVELEVGKTVLATMAGRLRRNRIKVMNGDRVSVELSPYDLARGRITFRHR